MGRSSLAVLLCAWLLWTPSGGSWQLHSAYTFRATCLVLAVWWDGYKNNRGTFGPSWCLPVGVDPNRLR